MGEYFVLPSSTYADPGFSPKDRVSGLVSFNFLESNLNSFCKADSVKFLVFNEGSKSRGISQYVQLSSLQHSPRRLFWCRSRCFRPQIDTVFENSDPDRRSKFLARARIKKVQCQSRMRPQTLTRLIQVNRRTCCVCCVTDNSFMYPTDTT
jgi:hypothetical protein